MWARFALVAVSGCGGPPCWSVASITAHLIASPDTLAGATVTFCRNGACTTGTFQAIADDGPTDIGTTGAFIAEAVATAEGTGVAVEVGILYGGRLQNGDIYQATITAISGTTLFAGSAASTDVKGT